jgi:ABC-type branched-subunit amino acid transport system ATPase component
MLKEESLTVVLVEHDMDVVFSLADRIAVLHRGRLIADGTVEEVKADAGVQDAYLGGLD